MLSDTNPIKRYWERPYYIRLAHGILLSSKNLYYLIKHFNKTSWYIHTFTDKRIQEEYEGYFWMLFEELEKIKTIYPNNMKGEKVLGYILYFILKRCDIGNVLETGVANGFTSRIIREFGKGKLYSTEINENAGILAEGGNFKVEWKVFVGKKYFNLFEALSNSKKITLFISDSGHTYENEIFELTCVDSKFPDSLMVTNIIDMKAIEEHCKEKDKDFIIIPCRSTSFCVLFPKNKYSKKDFTALDNLLRGF